MAIRFTVGSGNHRNTFTRAPLHTAAWDRQKEGFRMSLGMPAHGQSKWFEPAMSGKVVVRKVPLEF